MMVGQFPSSRLLAANILNHISRRGLVGKCYSFQLDFSFRRKELHFRLRS
jgi:hypothetical protein